MVIEDCQPLAAVIRAPRGRWGGGVCRPYLIFDGSAASAIEFYVKAFGAIELPGRLTGPAHAVLNAEIKNGDSILRLGDEAPWRIAKSPRSLGGTTPPAGPARNR